MTIIPVIDLAAGRVVHARGGLRADYQPLTNTCAGSSEPGAVIAALSTLYRFDRVYVADLDAIEGQGQHAGVLQSLTTDFPSYEFWLDAGGATLELADALQDIRLRPVIGSESHDSATLAAAIRTWPNAILSLDFRLGELLGDPALLDNTRLWPADVIIMTLDQVGQNSGPDINRINRIQRLSPAHNFYAAGGIRDDQDLARLADNNIAGALTATALHSQSLQHFRKTTE